MQSATALVDARPLTQGQCSTPLVNHKQRGNLCSRRPQQHHAAAAARSINRHYLHHQRRTSRDPRSSTHQYRSPVSAQSALLDVDWSGLSRMLLPPVVLSAAAFRQASESLAKRAAVDEVCRAFQVADKEELQDLLAALVLSECVYKKLEMPPQQLADTVASFLADFPADLVHLEALQLSRDDITQNYLVAVGGRSLYVAFMGTKQARDISTDLAFAQEAIWVAQEQQQQQQQEAAASSSSSSSSSTAGAQPSAHRGFLARAKAVPVEELQALAAASGRRLVLCGHSLGGAVAKLAGLRLLRAAPAWPPPSLRVVCFATPAVGNNALARLVEQAGWGGFFKTYVMPEDQLMRVLRFTQAAPTAAAAAAGATPIDSSSGTVPTAAAAGSYNNTSSNSNSPWQGLLSKLSGVGPVSAVVGVLQQPAVQESAREQLKRELQAEEANTAAMDPAASLDAADRAAAAAAATAAAQAAARGTSSSTSSSRGPAVTEAAVVDRAHGANSNSKGLFRSISRRLLHSAAPQDQQQQQQQSADTTPLLRLQSQPAAEEQQQQPDSNSSSSSDSLSAQNQSLGVALDLQARWLGYQLQQLGRAAAAPISTARRAVSVFYPFGRYSLITADGVLPPEAPLPGPSDPLSPQAAAFADANAGVLAFHRMIAHRTRCVYVVATVAAGLSDRGLLLPPAFRSVSRFVDTYALDIAGGTPTAAAVAVAGGVTGTADRAAAAAAGGGTAAAAAGQQQVAVALPKALPPLVRLGGVVPSIKVDAAVARPPLAPPPLLLPAADAALYGSSSSSTNVADLPSSSRSSIDAVGLSSSSPRSASPAAGPAAAAATAASETAATAASETTTVVAAGLQQQQQQARRSLAPLSFLPSGRSSRAGPEPSVPLVIRVQGANLKKARQLAVTALGERYPVTVLKSSSSSSGLDALTDPAAAAAGLGSLRGPFSADESMEDSSSSSSSSSRIQQQQGPQQQLGTIASVIARLHESAVAAGKALEGERPRWRLPRDRYDTVRLQVMLPASVVNQLTVTAVAAARQQQQQRQQLSLLPAATTSSSSKLRKARSSPALLAPSSAAAAAAAKPSAVAAAAAAAAAGVQQPRLQLLLTTDLQELAVPIPLQPHVVGVVGGSKQSALLLSHLLTHSGTLRQQYSARVAAAAVVTAGSNGSSSSSTLQKWLPAPASRSMQRLKAAAGASVAAQRLSLLSKQLLGKPQQQQQQQSVSAAEGEGLSPWQQPAVKRVRFADGHNPVGSSSSGENVPVSSSSSNNEKAAAFDASHSNGRQSSGAAVAEQVAPHSASSPAHKPPLPPTKQPSSSSSSSRGGSEGLRGVIYTTLPAGNGLLAGLPLPKFPSGGGSSGGGGGSSSSSGWQQQLSVSQVLKRATKQLQQQAVTAAAAAAQAGSHGGFGFLQHTMLQEQAADFMQWVSQQERRYNPVRFLAAPAAAAAAAASVLGAAKAAVCSNRSSSSSSNAERQADSSSRPGSSSSKSRSSSRPGSRDGTRSTSRLGAAAAAAAQQQQQPQARTIPVRAGTAAVAVSGGRKSPVQLKAAAANSRRDVAVAGRRPDKPAQQQQQQQRAWDVLLLAVTWDTDFITLLRHRSALGKLSAAAAAAGVQVVPVLLLEGGESAMSVRLTDLRAVGAPLFTGSSSGQQQHQQQQQQHGLLHLEDAASLLASALQVPAVRVCEVPLHGLLLPGAAAAAAAMGGNSSGGSNAGVLSAVGGLAQQYQLLAALQRLEGHIAGVLQQQQQQHGPPAGVLSKL